MTTTILAQKLLSMKLKKTEFEKIKRLKVSNSEKKYKSIMFLKQTLQKQISNKTCRLCLRPGYRRIFDVGYDFVNCIRNILGIQLTENDGKPEHICKTCEATLKNAELLKQTAEITQWRLQQELDMVADILDKEVKEDTTFHGGYFVEKGGKISRQWTCGKCRRKFDKQQEFSAHDQSPTCRANTTSYVCETCGLELKSITRLKRHRLIHSDELHFACAQCPYRARTKYALSVHARTHGAVRPHACPHCHATFLNSSNLASHRRRHLPPKYHCQLCKRSFRFKEALQNHLATQHSTAKPHICNTCGKAFSTRKMVCKHERRVHNRPKMRSGILPTYLRQLGEGLGT